MTGRCVVMVDKGRVEVQRRPVPAPGPGQVLVRADKTLISPGTERAILLALGEFSAIFPKEPTGYSFAGVVEAVGEGVTGFQPADRVCGPLYHQEYQVAEADRLDPVPAGVDAEEAAFLLLLQTALQGVRKARLEIGTRTLVLGLGLVGQLACRLARLNGAVPLVGADLSGRRREAARAACDIVLDPQAPDFRQQVLDQTAGQGPEVVIEVTGFPEPIKTAFQLCAPLGRVVLLGSTRGNVDDVNFYRDVHKRGLTVVGAHITSRPAQEKQPHLWPERLERSLCLDLLARRRVTVRDLISHRFPVDQAPQAYARLAQWDETFLGVILDWTS